MYYLNKLEDFFKKCHSQKNLNFMKISILLPKKVSPNCAAVVLTAATSQLFQLLWCWQSSGSEGWVQQGGYIPTTAMDDYWKVKMNHSPTPNLTLLVFLLFTILSGR